MFRILNVLFVAVRVWLTGVSWGEAWLFAKTITSWERYR